MATTQLTGSVDLSPGLQRKRSTDPYSSLDWSSLSALTRRRLFEDSSQDAQICTAPSADTWQNQPAPSQPEHLPNSQATAVPVTQQSQSEAQTHALDRQYQQLCYKLPHNTRQRLHGRLFRAHLNSQAAGNVALEIEHRAQTLFGERSPREDACWLDESALWTQQANHMGVVKFHATYGEYECVQMLRGLLHMMNAWRPSTEGAHFLDEDNKWLAGGRRSGKGGPAACIMKRMLALTRRQVLLSQHTPVLEALQRLVMLLQRRFSDCFPAGIYSYELRGLMHQVLTVQRYWRSDSGRQKAERAVQMLKAMINRVERPGEAPELSLEKLMQQLLDDFHPQTELVQERLKKHVQHLLKFGRERYDELQYAAVTADIHQALLINAGPGAGKTTVMALRALYLIGCLLHSKHSLSSAYDKVVALTFSKRAQLHMKQTLDGMCVRVANNLTFDGLWLKMANDFSHHVGRPSIKVQGQQEVKGFLSKNIDQQLNGMFDHGQCCFKPTGEAWKNLLDTISDLLAYQLQEAFVTKVGRNVYCFKDVWDERDARHRIRDAVLDNPQLGSSIHVSKLSLSGRSLRPVLMRAVTAFVQSFEDGDAAVWELLGYATRIWHIATGQLAVSPTQKLAAETIFKYWSSREAWLLDEFQDVSHAQYRLLKALTCHGGQAGQKRVTIVGDADQAIYDWRGADVQLFEEQFEADFAPVTQATLTVNYRSTPQIVARSNALITHNYSQLRGNLQYLNRSAVPKPLVAAPGLPHQQEVQFVRYSTKEAQAQHILERIKYWHTQGMWRDRAGVLQGPGVPYSQIRILARAKWQLYHLKSYLHRNGLAGHVTLVGGNADTDPEDDLLEIPEEEDPESKDEQVVLSSVHAVKGLECVVCFVVGLDQKGWKYRETPTWPDEVKQLRESRNVAYVAMTRAERVLYLSHIGSPEAGNSFFREAMLNGEHVQQIS